jgi:tetratricopeptide (TPR) repeat protein
MQNLAATRRALGNCHVCGRSVNTAGQRFCTSCGTRLSKTDWELYSTRPLTSGRGILSNVVLERIAKYQERRSPREAQMQYGLALVQRKRYVEAAQAFAGALAEEGSTPPTVDIQLRLADTLERANTPEPAFRTYLEAVCQETSLASELMPYLHAMLTPEIASALVGWFEGELEKSASFAAAAPIDRLHIDLFLCRMHLYVHDQAKVRDALLQAKLVDEHLFKAVAPALFTLESMPPAMASVEDGNSLLALAEISQILGQSEALALVEKALAVGLNDGTSQPDAPAYAIKAQALEERGELKDAAIAYYEAGLRYGWRDDNARAIQLLKKSLALDPTHCATYWQLVEVQRVLSYTEGYPYVVEEHARAALAAWETGIKLGEPASEFEWAYVARALLNEQLVRLPNANVSELNWEAIVFLERALLSNDEGIDPWAYLARFHRALGNTASALAASEHALNKQPENTIALEERAIILSNVGEVAAALEAIEKRRAVDSAPNVWLDALKAYNLLLTGPYDEALALLDAAIKTAPNEPWYLAVRAQCYFALQHWSLAADDWRRVWSHYVPGNANDRDRFAWAAFYLGDLSSARALFAAMAQDDPEADNAHRGLGLCALVEGKQDAARWHLALGIADARTIRSLDDLLIVDFPFVRHVAEVRSKAEMVNRVLAEVTPDIEKRRHEVSVARLPETELHEAIDTADSSAAATTWAWVGAHAALARLQAETGDWEASAATYQLLQASGRFLRAGVGLARAVDSLIQDARRHLTEGDTGGAEQHLAKARPFVVTAEQAVRRGDLHAVTAMVRFAAGDTTDADREFVEALRSYRVVLAHAGERLAAEAGVSIASIPHYWAIRDRWDAQAVGADVDEMDRKDLTAAREALSSYLTEALSLRESAEEKDRVPVVRPLVLEIATELLPVVDPEQDGGDFLSRRISEMRSRLEAALGIAVPGVRARTLLSPNGNGFRVRVDEASVVQGVAYRSMTFCAGPVAAIARAGVEESAIVPAWNYATGIVGAWVPEEHREAIVKSGLAIQMAPEFLAAQIEAVIQRYASNFLGLDEMDRLIQGWQTDDADTVALIAPQLENVRTRLALLRLLRELLREHVSLAPWKEIVQAVHQVGLDDGNRAVDAVRQRLKVRLVADAAHPRLVPEEWEQWVRRQDGELRFVGSAIDVHHALTTVRAWMQQNDRPTVIVTRTPELRRYVRRLLENEFPLLPVLASNELLEGGTIVEDVNAAVSGEMRTNG